MREGEGAKEKERERGGRRGSGRGGARDTEARQLETESQREITLICKMQGNCICASHDAQISQTASHNLAWGLIQIEFTLFAVCVRESVKERGKESFCVWGRMRECVRVHACGP